ncbi:MAG: universal stress protein [Phyllobacterium sp.]|uniref:universal stress protein n=1 Tax=Phyllobacterium sp. TaxID=1871046 RepID=UPI0030F313B2
MRTLALLPLITYPDASSEKVIVNAITVAAHLGADLHALAMNVNIPDVSNAFAEVLLNLPEMVREAERNSRTAGIRLLTAIKQKAAEMDVALTTGEITAHPVGFGDVAAVEARYSDLSLMGWEAKSSAGRMTTEGLVFGSGRPVILLPDLAAIDALDHVMIAWDGSRVAARALADAQPFLQRAKRTSIVTILDEKPIHEKNIGERLAISLRRRGLAVESACINTEGRPIGETLQNHALKIGAKLLVMGGYGHSRIRDFVLGGATEDVLNDVRLPILLSH